MKKKSFWNRSLSLLLTFVMVLGLVPGGLLAVSAAEADEPDHSVSELERLDDGRVSNLRIDFKEFAQKASEQSWWKQIGDTTDENVKVFGTTSSSQNLGSRKDAYNEMLQYLAENESWNINETQSQFSNASAVKRLFLDNSANPFGLRFFVSRFSSQTTSNPGYSRLVLDINLPEGADGWYKMALEVFHESFPSNIPIVDELYAGSPYGDIYVNDELVYDEFYFGSENGNYQAEHNFGQVYLHGGSNTFAIDVTSSFVNDLSNGRRTVNLCTLEFKALTGVEVDEYATSILDLNEDYIAYGDSPAGFTAKVENSWIATTSINNKGIVTINGIRQGETYVDILDGDKIYCSIPIRVKAFEGTFDDLMGNPTIVEFTTAVDRAEEQSWWNGTAAVTEDGQFNAWLKENAKWKIAKAEELIANGDDNTYGFAAKGENAFSVALAAEGLYNISVEYLCGDGSVDVRVNDELLYEGLSTEGTGNLKRSVGTAVLKKGENILTFTSEEAVFLRSVVFTPLGVWQTEVDVSRYIDLNETYLAYDRQMADPKASCKGTVAVDFDQNGKLVITGAMEGQGMVTVTDGSETICTLNVSVLPAAKMKEASFLLDGFRTEILQLGQVAKGELVGKTENGTVLCEEYLRDQGDVYFESSDHSVATVDQATGDVTCVGEGTATIYAYTRLDGVLKQDNATIVVSDDTDLVGITLRANADYVAVGDILYLQVSGKRSSGGKADMSKIPLVYTVDNADLAVVSAQGGVTGKALGKVTVTATVGVQRSAVTGSITLDVVDSTKLPQGNIILDFTNGRLGNIQTATLEKDDICINRELSLNGGEDITPYAKYGYAFVVSEGEGMAFDFVVRRSGWYSLDTEGGLYSAGNFSDIFVDNAYVGTIDFCRGKNGDPYGAICKGNTIWLDAGVHTIRLIGVTSGTQYLGKFTFYASSDPNPISVKLRSEKTELLVNEQAEVYFDAVDANGRAYHLKAATGSANYENHYILEIGNSNISVNGSSIVGRKAGNTQIVAIGQAGKDVFSKSLKLKVVKGKVSRAELTAEQTTVKPNAGPFQLTTTVYGVYGSALTGTFDISYESGDTSIAQVSADGMVTLTGETGSVLITASIADEGRTVKAELWITVTKGKTAPTVYTYEERAIAQKNTQLYAWAWQQKEAAVKKADYVVEHLDQFYNMVIPEALPRSYRIVYLSDNINYKYCPICKEDLFDLYGHYAWKIDPIEKPWKITCPVCSSEFPSNDFEAYYNSGVDEQGKFHPDRADRSLLVNELYPEMGEGWGVDDGFGYNTGTTVSGVPLVYTFIAHYMHGLYMSLSDHDLNDMGYALDSLREAYIFTGDEKYGSAGAILLDRMADIYPEYDIDQYSMEYANSHGGNGLGKMVGSIWEGSDVGLYLARAADAFWPAMDNDDVVEYLRQRHVLKGIEDPEEITPEYIRAHVDENILLDIKKGCENYRIAGNFGMSQAVMCYAAVALDRMPETEQMIDWAMRYGEVKAKTTGYGYNNTGGNVMYNLVNLVDRDGFGDEVSTAYLGLWLSYLANVSDALDGYTGVEGVDLWKNSKYVSLYKGYSNMIVVGRNSPIVGETGGMQTIAFPLKVNELLLAYQKTKDPEIAQALYFANGNSVNGLHGDIYSEDPEGIRNEIKQVIAEHGELRFNDSVMLSGYGIGMLKDGPEKYLGINVNADRFSAAWMYFGQTYASHAQLEALNIDLYAHGLSLSGSMGYPLAVTTSDPERMQWVANTSSHNTVVVDDEAQSMMNYGGYPLHFDDAEEVKVLDAHAPAAYAQTDIYRRTLVQVLAPNGEPYTVDFFRVLGGSEHVYSFHVATMQQPTTQGLDFVRQPMGTYAGADVPYGPSYIYGDQDATMNTGSGYSWLDDVYRDHAPETTFVLDYPVDDFHHQLSSSAGLRLKMIVMSEEPMTEVALANGHPPQNKKNPEHVEYVLIRRSGTNGMDSLFTTVFEPYHSTDQIASSQLVDVTLVEGTELATDKVSAIKVTMRDGRVDYIVYATNYDCTYDVDGKFEFRGFAGVCSYYDEQLVYAYGNEATKIAGTEENFLPAITGTVTDFTKDLSFEGYTMTLKLDQTVTEDDFEGRYIYVNNDGERNAAYRIHGVELDGDVAVIDLKEQTLVRKFVDGANMDLGYVYNIAEGDAFTIPLSATFDSSAYFSYTADTVAKAGSKLSLTIGNAMSGAVYEAEGLTSGMKLDAATGTLTWSISRTQTGRYPIAVKALEDGEVVAEMSFVIYVVSYSGSTYAPDVCAHAKTVTYTVDGRVEAVCPACGLITKTEEEKAEKFDILGSNMTLGNELKLNVLVKSSDLGGGTYTAKITHNGEETEQTFVRYNGNYHCVIVAVAAKEMADVITVEIYDENGNAVSNVYETSVRSYAMNILGNAAMTAKIKTLVVDMLNYGSEAQTYFKYNEADLANSKLTAEQKALATEAVSCTNKQVKGENFYGASLSLEDSILLNLFFKNCKDGYTAKIIFTDFRGDVKTVTKELIPYSGSIYKIVVDDVVLADAFSTVTTTIYDANGNVVGSGTDSVESYIARTGDNALNEAIMKFASSAKAYLS